AIRATRISAPAGAARAALRALRACRPRSPGRDRARSRLLRAACDSARRVCRPWRIQFRGGSESPGIAVPGRTGQAARLASVVAVQREALAPERLKSWLSCGFAEESGKYGHHHAVMPLSCFCCIAILDLVPAIRRLRSL